MAKTVALPDAVLSELENRPSSNILGDDYVTPRGSSTEMVEYFDGLDKDIANKISYFFCTHDINNSCIDVVIDNGVVLYSVECNPMLIPAQVYEKLIDIHALVLSSLLKYVYGWDSEASIEVEGGLHQETVVMWRDGVEVV